ncbi:hypothetical protein EDD15DRAFT_2197893 [Pisolithus albus]|nr:hypothetical protein EDD15DRAFT_2197893 [Pisolithus albus]
MLSLEKGARLVMPSTILDINHLNTYATHHIGSNLNSETLMLVHYTSVYGLVIRPCMGSEVHVRRNINSVENILRTARSLAENLTGIFPMSTRPGTVRVTSETGLVRITCHSQQTGKNLGKRSLPIEIRRVDNITPYAHKGSGRTSRMGRLMESWTASTENPRTTGTTIKPTVWMRGPSYEEAILDLLRASLRRAESIHAEFPDEWGRTQTQCNGEALRNNWSFLYFVQVGPRLPQHAATRSLSFNSGKTDRRGSVKCGSMISRILAVFPSPLLSDANVRYEARGQLAWNKFRRAHFFTNPSEMFRLLHRGQTSRSGALLKAYGEAPTPTH